jgi:hypothetical protein
MAQKKMRDQLKEIRRATSSTPSAFNMSRFPANPNMHKEEGVDHLNLYWSSQFELGKYLSLSEQGYFSTPVLGNFKSLMTVIQFLGAEKRDDKIRNLAGNPLRFYVKQHCGGYNRARIPNGRAVIMHTAYLRLIQNKKMFALFKECDLAFDSYHVIESGLRVREDDAAWVCKGYEEIRRALKENREPDFRFLFDRGERSVYESVIKMLSEGKTEVRIPDMTDFIATYRPMEVGSTAFDPSQVGNIDGVKEVNSVESTSTPLISPESKDDAVVETSV